MYLQKIDGLMENMEAQVVDLWLCITNIITVLLVTNFFLLFLF